MKPRAPPPAQFIAAISERLASQQTEGITVRPVECLAVCKRPCTLALAAADKWTYVIGDLTLEHSDDVVAAAIAFQRSPNGIVPWSERPQPFRKGVIARVPPLGLRATRSGDAMTDIAKVPCSIVTGFLGAGKTTLVRHILENAKGRRLAVIVNEFGDVGIDGEILKGCGVETCSEDRIVELSNGCICCTVADDFVPALESLLGFANPPEHIIIETSGLALPKPLVQAFNWPAIASRVTVDGVIAVVDGAAVAAGRFADDPEALAKQKSEDSSLDHDNPLEEVYEDQLLCADLIVLNKADLLSAAERARVTDEIRAAVPRAVKVVETEGARIDPNVLLGLKAAAEGDLAARPSHHDQEEGHDHDDFESFIVEIPAVDAPGRGARAHRHGHGRARHSAREGLCRRQGQADAPADPGRRPAPAASIRPRLASGRAPPGPARRHRSEGARSRGYRARHRRRLDSPHAPACDAVRDPRRDRRRRRPRADGWRHRRAVLQRQRSFGPRRGLARTPKQTLPSLRLASLKRLRHPMSVDLYVDDVVSKSRLVIVRSLGGLDYWRYGFEQVAEACRRSGAEARRTARR